MPGWVFVYEEQAAPVSRDEYLLTAKHRVASCIIMLESAPILFLIDRDCMLHGLLENVHGSFPCLALHRHVDELETHAANLGLCQSAF